MTSTVSKTLSKLCAYLMHFDPDMPVSRLRVFLFIAQRKDTLVKDLVELTGLNQSTVSRTVAILGTSPQRSKQPGLGWVDARPDPGDPRRVVLNLSAKGRRIMAEVEELSD